MNWCARSEVKCTIGYIVYIEWNLRKAAVSGAALREWASRVGDWQVLTWQDEVLQSAMRHSFTISLNLEELRTLSIVASDDSLGCYSIDSTDAAWFAAPLSE